MLADVDRLQASMRDVSPEAAALLPTFVRRHHSEFDYAREKALASVPRPIAVRGEILIAGVSAGGAIAAKIAAEAGYKVTAYEPRPNPSRRVTWGARQSVIDAVELYFGSEVARRFSTELAAGIGGVYRHLNVSGMMDEISLPRPSVPMASHTSGRMDGRSIVSSLSPVAVEVREVETLLRSALAQVSGVELRMGEKAPDLHLLPSGRFGPVGTDRAPILIIAADGASGQTGLAASGIRRIPLTDERLQVAGVIYGDIPGGNAVGGSLRLPGSSYTIVSGSLYRAGSKQIWFVTDLDPGAVTPGPQFAENSPEWKTERSRLVELHYRQIASAVLKIPQGELDRMQIGGATGGPLAPFKMQLGFSQTAMSSNLLLWGDRVANGHWSAGAGGMMSMTAHPDNLANYLNDLDRGVDPVAAARELNEKQMRYSREWLRAGLPSMYPDAPAARVQLAFDAALAEWDRERDPAAPVRERIQALVSIPAVTSHNLEGAKPFWRGALECPGALSH